MTVSAPSRHRAFWGDTRFFIGLALVAAAVTGVWFVVTAARESAPVLVAARTLVPGDVLTDQDVRAEEAALGSAAGVYLTPAQLEAGEVITRTVAEGEMLPAGAVAPADTTHRTSVVVRTSAGVPAEVDRGSLVELWSAAPAAEGGFDVPAILVADATVAEVAEAGGMVADGTVRIELVIPRADVARTLEAVAAEAALSIVPAGTPR